MIRCSGSGKEEQMFPSLLVRGFCGIPEKSGEVFVGLSETKPGRVEIFYPCHASAH